MSDVDSQLRCPTENLQAHQMNTDKLLPQNCERLSALADGELGQEEFAALLQACERDPTASGSWSTYHVIGELLRSPGNTVQLADFAFLARLKEELAKEPPFGMDSKVPLPHPGVNSVFTSAMAVGERRGPASNDGNFRWKVVAGFACAAAVSAIAWNVNVLTAPMADSRLAQLGQLEQLVEGGVPPRVVVASPQGPMVRDIRLEELLAAHKQLGATPALPVPSGFLRNATFETQQSLGR